MKQHPWFAAAIIGTLALGIGINTTVFTLVNAVLFKPLPFPGGDRLVMVHEAPPNEGQRRVGVSYADLVDFRGATRSFERLEAYSNFGANLSEQGNPPARYRGARVTSGLFAALQTPPVLGRALGPQDEGPAAQSVMLLGYGVWKERYAGDPKVIGRSVVVNEKPAVIVGVMPEGVKFPNNEDVWMNVVLTEEWQKRENRAFDVVGMLRPGVSRTEAAAELATIAQRLEREYPKSHQGYGVTVKTFHEVMNGGPIRLMFSLMMGAVGFVLLIACANVANLLLGRALSRRREISIRVAMGAGKARILRQLLVESVTLSVLGGLLGLVLARSAVKAFALAVENVGKPSWILFEMDYTVFLYFGAICVLSGLLFGLAPALQASRVDLNEALKEGAKSSGTRGGGYLSGGLVVVQFTLAVILLSAAGLMIRSFLAAQDEFAHMRGEEVLNAALNLPEKRYTTPEARYQFFEKLQARLSELPGAMAVGLTSDIPSSSGWLQRFEIAGQEVPVHERRPEVRMIRIAPGYLSVLGVPVLQGRDFTSEDGLPGKESVIVTRKFAERFFPKGKALGQQIRLFDGEKKAQEWMTVVGITPDQTQVNPGRQDDAPGAIVPYRWRTQTFMQVLIRTKGDAAALSSGVRHAVAELDPVLPLFELQTLEQSLERSRWHLRVFGTLFLSFAVIALGLAAVGIYAVLAHATAQRTREIGVRLALGANPGTIVRMVLNRGLVQIGLGMGLGLTAAYYTSKLMATFLFKVTATDPVTFGIVSVTLLGAGLAACLIPAWRASRLDPVTALRHE